MLTSYISGVLYENIMFLVFSVDRIQATTKVSDLSDIKFSLTPSLRSRA